MTVKRSGGAGAWRAWTATLVTTAQSDATTSEVRRQDRMADVYYAGSGEFIEGGHALVAGRLGNDRIAWSDRQDDLQAGRARGLELGGHV